jgi:hypothetical protein
LGILRAITSSLKPKYYLWQNFKIKFQFNKNY